MNEENKEVLEGGLGDDKTLADLAAKHNVPIERIKEEWERGVKVEAEHTDDPKIAAEIAKDHLTEDPLYYEKLAKVETAPEVATVPKEQPKDLPAEQPKPEPVINIDDIVAKAVNAALEKATTQFTAALQDLNAKHASETEQITKKHDAEIKQMGDQITELKRTAPTGVPNQQTHIGTEEMEEAARQRKFAESYRKGFR